MYLATCFGSAVVTLKIQFRKIKKRVSQIQIGKPVHIQSGLHHFLTVFLERAILFKYGKVFHVH